MPETIKLKMEMDRVAERLGTVEEYYFAPKLRQIIR